ncbi:MAG: hypothetical protein J7J98_06085, partial [candidate division Zixibacteria bacterium]|nr:hypothetical protein [candidate division Zixibacteria bacterium]
MRDLLFELAVGFALVCIITMMPATQTLASERLNLSIDYEGAGSGLSEQELMELFPRTLIEYTFAGQPQWREAGRVQVVPVRDSSGLRYDTVSVEPRMFLAVCRDTLFGFRIY